jgi:hypothetical protein
MESTTAVMMSPVLPGDDLVEIRPGDPDASSVEQFSNLMDGESAAPSTQAVDRAAKPEGGTLGDRILSGLHGLSSDMERTQKGIADALAHEDVLSAQSMLALQYRMATLSVQYDAISKATGKTVEGIRQLVTQQ